MISKTQLATNPRHRPDRNYLANGWREAAAGEWSRDVLRVILESDGLWHSYASPGESVFQSPGFYAVTEAMRDAEKRAPGVLRSA